MIRKVFSLLVGYLIIISNFFGQEITYKAVLISPCSNQIIDFYRYQYSLTDENEKIFFSKKNEETISVPKLGKYKLSLSMYDYPFEIELNKFGLTIDTLLKNELYYLDNYTICKLLADKQVKTYYKKDLLRSVGTFRNGKLVDTLKMFYENGTIKSVKTIDSVNRFNIYMKANFKNGTLQKLYDFKNKIQVYYSKPNIKSNELTWENDSTYIFKSFYDDGNLQSLSTQNTASFYSNKGVLISSSIWTKNIIDLKLYDTLKNCILEVKYEYIQSVNPFEYIQIKDYKNSLSLINSENILQVNFYKADKLIRQILKNEVENIFESSIFINNRKTFDKNINDYELKEHIYESGFYNQFE